MIWQNQNGIDAPIIIISFNKPKGPSLHFTNTGPHAYGAKCEEFILGPNGHPSRLAGPIKISAFK